MRADLEFKLYSSKSGPKLSTDRTYILNVRFNTLNIVIFRNETELGMGFALPETYLMTLNV